LKFLIGVFLGINTNTGSFSPLAEAQNAHDIFVLSLPEVTLLTIFVLFFSYVQLPKNKEI
jgi:hypothetical protein